MFCAMQYVFFADKKNGLIYQGITDLLTFVLYFLFVNWYPMDENFLF